MGKNNEGLSKHREDGIAKSSRKKTNAFERIIIKVRVSKHREEGIAKESRNILNGLSRTYMYLVCTWLVLAKLL